MKKQNGYVWGKQASRVALDGVVAVEGVLNRLWWDLVQGCRRSRDSNNWCKVQDGKQASQLHTDGFFLSPLIRARLWCHLVEGCR